MEVLWIALGAIGIALIVFILKKTIPGLSSNEEVDEKEAADNNVNRMTVPFEKNKENETKEETKEEDGKEE